MELADIIQIFQALAILVLGIGLIMVAVVGRDFRRRLIAVEEALGEIARDARPALDRARAIGENLNHILMSMRKEVDRVGDTISRANERLETALDVAEERARELAALIEVVQAEVGDTVLDATSALRGLRAGAKALREARGNKHVDAEGRDTRG